VPTLVPAALPPAASTIPTVPAGVNIASAVPTPLVTPGLAQVEAPPAAAALPPAASVPTLAPALRPVPLPTVALPAFDPQAFIGQGDRYNCGDFASQARAQAVLRADPRDPNRLDTDRDGIACEGNPAPKDLVLVPRL
jgi:hypothetical protein